MSRLSFRPRPLDIHKKLPIVKSIKEFEDDDAPAVAPAAGTRSSLLHRLTVDAESEVHQTPTSKKSCQEIPTPQYSVVDTYERDYSCTFAQPTTYVRARGARAEIREFVDYDLDNEDEDWLQEFNNERKVLAPEIFEMLLYKLEVLDQKTRERTGVMQPTFGSPVPVLLELDAAFEACQSLSLRFAVFQSAYNYWKAKRERWQKPILRRLQPPPPVNDTNPYNVFRPREKAYRHHTRRMQRRENNVQSFEKLRQVRRNLDQVKSVVEALIKREEKKRDVTEAEVNLQCIQLKYKHEAKLVDDALALTGKPAPSRFLSSDDDLMDSDDTINYHPRLHPASVQQPHFTSSKRIIIPTGRMKRELQRRPLTNGWSQKRDPYEPVLLFTRSLDQEKLASVGIVQPQDPPSEDGAVKPPYHFHGRIGRGGRIIFDRWNPLSRAPLGAENSYVAPYPKPPQPNG